jgi:plasmid stabilization system protein ParE
MKSGYNVLWTDHALSELKNTIEFLENKWTEKELKNFFQELEHTIEIISKNPDLFQVSEKKKNIRRAIIAQYNTLYYQTKNDTVHILSLFSNRQDPNNLKI